MEKHLFKYWEQALNYFDINAQEYLDIYIEIENHYKEPKRKYHNLNHVNHMIELISSIEVNSYLKNIMILSAFLHDIIYIPGSRSNELKSAQYSNLIFSEIGLKSSDIKTIEKLILATKKHYAKDSETKVFTDIDLSILGANKERYNEYSQGVKAEFNHIPYWIYKKGRKKFLKSLLSQPKIFQTNQFVNLLEKQARINIKNELKNI